MLINKSKMFLFIFRNCVVDTRNVCVTIALKVSHDGPRSVVRPVRLFVHVSAVVVEQLGSGEQRGRMAAAGGRVAVVHRSVTDAEWRYCQTRQ